MARIHIEAHRLRLLEMARDCEYRQESAGDKREAMFWELEARRIQYAARDFDAFAQEMLARGPAPHSDMPCDDCLPKAKGST